MLKYLENVVTLQLNGDVCNGCGLCINVCPQAVFVIKEKKALIVDRDACIECGACSNNCPVGAINVQTGAGCAAGILGSAIGIDNCCSGECGISPKDGRPDQSCCNDSGPDGKTNNKHNRLSLTSTRKLSDNEKSKRFVIYEAATCCSSGTCCDNADSLIELQDAADKLEGMGGTIEHYSITSAPGKFRDNPDVIKLLQEYQSKALPITTINGKVIKYGSYPTFNELSKYLPNP